MTPSLIALFAPAKTRSATWDDYLTHLANPEDCRVFFNNGFLWVEMGNEGINHARFCDLITFIFGVWFMERPDIEFDALSGCVLASVGKQGAAPDSHIGIVSEEEGINIMKAVRARSAKILVDLKDYSLGENEKF